VPLLFDGAGAGPMRSVPAAFAMVALLYQIVSDTHKPSDGYITLNNK
jgi:hypothetical protein